MADKARLIDMIHKIVRMANELNIPPNIAYVMRGNKYHIIPSSIFKLKYASRVISAEFHRFTEFYTDDSLRLQAAASILPLAPSLEKKKYRESILHRAYKRRYYAMVSRMNKQALSSAQKAAIKAAADNLVALCEEMGVKPQISCRYVASKKKLVPNYCRIYERANIAGFIDTEIARLKMQARCIKGKPPAQN
jgi:hypothetical protein